MAKIVHIFIASSTQEFGNERIYIGDFVHKLNNYAKKQDIRIKLYLCEDESKNYQPIYDRNIIGCNIFIALIGREIRPFTQHEINIANSEESKNIKKRILVFNSSSNSNFSIGDVYGHFEKYIFESNFLENVCELTKTIIREILPDLPDCNIESSTNTFKISLPHFDGTFESAIISNIIRGFNDQHGDIFNITTEEDVLVCDASLTILKEGLDSEKDRIRDILKISSSSVIIWILVDKIYALNICELIDELGNRYHHYPEFYESYKELSRLFKIQLADALLPLKNYKYIIEDHILKRQSLVNKANKSIIKELSIQENLPIDLDRRERVILNVLELYRITGNQKKHSEALKRIYESEYDFFIYNPNDIKNLPSDQYQANVDYVIDSLCSLMKIRELNEKEVYEKIVQITSIPSQHNYFLEKADEFHINYLIASVLSSYDALQKELESTLKKTLRFYYEIPVPDFSDNELALQSILQLCELYYKKNKGEYLLRLGSMGLDLCANLSMNKDIYSKFMLMVYLARGCRLLGDFEETNNYYEKAEELMRPNYNNDNISLNLYIQLRYERIMDGRKNVLLYKDEIRDLQQKYNQFLSNGDYLLVLGYLKILYASLISSSVQCDEAIEIIEKNKLLKDNDPRYLYMFYVKSEILQRSKNEEDIRTAIQILEDLYESYLGAKDKALCQQNIALCYMKLYQLGDSLALAVNAYNKALTLYKGLNAKEYMGNIYDGLSYSLLLQKRFEESNRYANLSINCEQYTTPYKHCNYISSLICCGRYITALRYFHKCKEKELICSQIISDTKEMNDLGISIKRFRRMLFIFNKIK